MSTVVPRPCGHDPATPAECGICRLYLNNAKVRARWEEMAAKGEPLVQAGTPTAAAAPRGECRHLGSATGTLAACLPCGAGVKLKVFGCALHGECTLAKPSEGKACCATCPDYSSAKANDPPGAATSQTT